jgi:hypothetical protein
MHQGERREEADHADDRALPNPVAIDVVERHKAGVRYE